MGNESTEVLDSKQTADTDQSLVGNQQTEDKDGTLLGGDKATDTNDTAKPVLTPEQQAENKRLLEAKDETLSPEDKTKKADLVKSIANSVPEKYDFKLPEGVTLDQKTMEIFTPLFKEAKLPQGLAQKIVDAAIPWATQQVEAHKTQMDASFKEMTESWKADAVKELGPEYQKELAFAAKAMEKSGIPGLRELVNETRVGNHIAMIKFMVWAGKNISQDSMADSTTKHKSVDTAQAQAEVLYPSMKK